MTLPSQYPYFIRSATLMVSTCPWVHPFVSTSHYNFWTKHTCLQNSDYLAIKCLSTFVLLNFLPQNV